MMNKTLIILCGLPACGKTTYRNDFLIKDSKNNFVYSTDDVLEDLARQTGTSYGDMFRVNIKWATEMLDSKLNDAFSDEVPLIIWDQTNLSRKKRDSIRRKASAAGYSTEVHCFPIPPDLNDWQRRLMFRKDKVIPQNVIESMKETYEIPGVQTNENDVSRYIYLDNGCFIVSPHTLTFDQ